MYVCQPLVDAASGNRPLLDGVTAPLSCNYAHALLSTKPRFESHTAQLFALLPTRQQYRWQQTCNIFPYSFVLW